jgi:hypothetical protein
MRVLGEFNLKGYGNALHSDKHIRVSPLKSEHDRIL